MAIIKNAKTGKWEVRTYYKDQNGVRKQKTKRGFAKKKEAEAWEREFKICDARKMNMKFADFVGIYLAETSSRLRESTLDTKRNLIETKLLPYFGGKNMDEISRADVLRWQNEMRVATGKNGKPFSPGYLRAMHNQLSTILNHAVNVYGLKSNAARKPGNICKEQKREMLFWTPEEFSKFIKEEREKRDAYHAFEILFWTGIRVGELLALTSEDFEFQGKTLRINKSLQRRKGRDVVTPPKTEKSNRTVLLPDFLSLEMQEYLGSLEICGDTRVFGFSANFLRREMKKGAARAGVKRIRIHDLRHSHVSLLIAIGYSALEIAERVGHEAIDITYRYAHLFPTIQRDMAMKLNGVREGMALCEKGTGK